jgi:UDP-glucose 4-epimerase
MTEILITGGAGFIGINLVRALGKRNGPIRVLDNLEVGLAQDLDGLPVDLLVGDILDAQAVAAAMEGIKTVVHLAAHTGVVESVADPEHDMAVNVMGTLNLLQAAVRQRVNRFIFASTGGAIIGDAPPPIHEAMAPQPLSPYGASKLAGEGYCSAFWGSYGLKTVSLRFSNVYGPYSHHKGSIIAKLFKSIKTGKDLTIYGNGEQTRDFLFVADVCWAIIASMRAGLPYGQAIQLGMGQETSINELTRLMRQVVGEERFPLVNYAPPRLGEVRRNFALVDRARQYLGFIPKTDLLTGLRHTWDWFRLETEY